MDWIPKKKRMLKQVKAAGKWPAFVAARDKHKVGKDESDPAQVQAYYEAAYEEVMADVVEVVRW